MQKPKMGDPANAVTIWQAIIGQVIAIFGLVGGYIFHSGRKTERLDQQYRAFTKESEALKTEICEFRVEVGKMREAFAALTGKTINGADYRG